MPKKEYRSKFEAWVYEHANGTKALSEKLGVAQTTVQHWINRHAIPSLIHAEMICILAKGKLSLQDILKGTRPLYGSNANV